MSNIRSKEHSSAIFKVIGYELVEETGKEDPHHFLKCVVGGHSFASPVNAPILPIIFYFNSGDKGVSSFNGDME